MLLPSGRLLRTLIRPATVVLLSSVSVVGACFPAPEVRAEDLPVRGSGEDPAVWAASLRECIWITLQQSDEIRRWGTVSVDGDSVDIHIKDRRLDQVLRCRRRVENIARDVESAYWDLWVRHGAHQSAIHAEEQASRVREHATPARDSGSSGKTESELPSREAKVDARPPVETTHKELRSAERALLELMNAAEDRRLIRPSDEPAVDEADFQFDEVQREALANRSELLPPRLDLLYYRIELEDGRGDNRIPAISRTTQVERHEVKLWQAKIDIFHDVEDAVRGAERACKVMELQLANLRSATEDFEKSWEAFDRGEIAADATLESLCKKADAEWSYYKALRDCAVAIARVHQSKGTLLERYRIEVLADGAADPQVTH